MINSTYKYAQAMGYVSRIASTIAYIVNGNMYEYDACVHFKICRKDLYSFYSFSRNAAKKSISTPKTQSKEVIALWYASLLTRSVEALANGASISVIVNTFGVSRSNINWVVSKAMEEYVKDDPTELDLYRLVLGGDISAKDLPVDYKETVKYLLGLLSPRREMVLRMRIGLDNNKHTLDQVAREFNVTKEVVRRIESQALMELRSSGKVDMLKLGIKKYNSLPTTKEIVGKDKPIEQFNFSVRTYNCLKRAGFNTLSDFNGVSVYKLLQIRNFREWCVEEVISSLKKSKCVSFSGNVDNISLTKDVDALRGITIKIL